MSWAGNVARMENNRKPYRVLVWKPEGKRNLGNQRFRWGDNIKMCLTQTGWAGVDWSNLAQDRDRRRVLVNAVVNFRVR